MKALCVFCGSSAGNAPEYVRVAIEVGELVARRGIRLVYGGGNTGLMHAVADSCLAASGSVVGIMPKALVEREKAHLGLTELRIVSSMHERKATMAEMSDAFLALPGGFGTLEEFFEVLTWSQLGLHRKPCGLLNVGGYYNGLIAMADHAVAEGFVKLEHRSLLLVDRFAERLIDSLLR